MRRKKGKKRPPPPPPTRQNFGEDGEGEESDFFDDEDDDYESSQYAPLLGSSISLPLENEKKWDDFENSPIEDVTRTLENPKLYQAILVVLKILTYGVVFIVVLGGAVLAKMALLMMTSQIHPGTKRPFCFFDQRRLKQVEITLPERVQWAWALSLCFAFPEVFTLIRSLRISIFKRRPRPRLIHFLIPCFFEMCHVIGLCLLTFCVLPGEHVIKGAMMTNAVCLLPGILALLSRQKFKNVGTQTLAVLDMAAIGCQLLALTLWSIASSSNGHPDHKYWLFPLSAILTSCGWWESYLSPNSGFAFIRRLAKMRENFERSRYPAHIYISILKMAVFFGTMWLSIVIIGDDPYDYFDLFETSVAQSNILHVTEVNDPITNGLITNPDLPIPIITQKILNFPSSSWAVYAIVTTQFLAAFLCYAFAKFACRICIQRFSFAFPLTLSVPVTLTALIWLCGARAQDPCYASAIFPDYLYWNCPGGDFASDFLNGDHGWVWILLLLSQAWITLHAWFPSNARLANTEVIFCTPMYNALLTDQNLLMNRKRDQEDAPMRNRNQISGSKDGNQEVLINYKDEEKGVDPPIDLDAAERLRMNHQILKDSTSHIIACATMWHEEKDEMIAMLKSVFRMDCEHWTQRQFVKEFGHRHRDYFEYETHIFFDDAFERKNKKRKGSPYVINEYVRKMLCAILEACQRVHLGRILMASPTKYPTPYGGLLVYTLPGGTLLTIHLKNKDKIRHRKRWSQVMYMYYLLKHRLRDQNLPPKREKTIAQNTYLLALDGDIDFQPHAVKLLVDRMKRHDKLGAACGRIHPTGAGPMVWYQKFEYAIGHWLQKATEHMIGCVLCSPGCFSLFRARGLMSDRVMRKYTTMSEKPRDYVQYDQGEDRWLCTLLLQQGYRVEYCAASDAFTNAPGGFDEFYNQRRRWVPSTMANILDLLADYRRTVQKNQDISTLYILYQFVLMGGSILGPGTIFLMLVGAFVAAFKINNLNSFCINLAPLLLFILVCYFCQEKSQKWKQLALAKLLSAIYALVMVAVLIAILLQVIEDGLLAPSSIFMVAITLSFIIAAIVHPLEFGCLPHGVIYYITIPSMYLLLIIYSLFNLNDVTWGTRDNPSSNQPEDETEESPEKDATASRENGDKNSNEGFFSNVFSTAGLSAGAMAGQTDMEASFGIDCGALCRFSCCLAPRENKFGGQKIVEIVSESNAKSARGSSIPSSVISVPISPPQVGGGGGATTTGGFSRKGSRPLLTEIEEEFGHSSASMMEKLEEKETDRNPLLNPWWLEDPLLNRAPTDFLPTVEIKFWKQLIQTYLKPIDEDKNAKKKLEAELLQLRNYTVGAFLMFNAVFVTAMFLLQMNKDQLFFEWPIGATHNMTFVAPQTVTVQTTKLHLEPLGLLFVGFYAVILVIQFIAMMFHRLGTFSHIMASTSIFKMCGRKIVQLTSTEIDDTVDHVESGRFDVIRALAMKPTTSEEGGETDTATEDGQRSTATTSPTVQRRRRTTSENVPVFSLDQQYEKSFKKLAKSPERLKRMSKFVPNLEMTMGEIQATREHGQSSASGSRRPSENFLTQQGRRRTLAPGNVGRVVFAATSTTSF